jgi:uncharacterized protein
VRAVLVDAGPLVAILDRADRHHTECVEALRDIRVPLLTVWPAFTEAMYLLNFSPAAQDALWHMLETNTLLLAPLDASDAPRMNALMKKYRDAPMDLADAALVRVAEREHIAQIFTIDRRHFSIYRPSRLGRFTLLPTRARRS